MPLACLGPECPKIYLYEAQCADCRMNTGRSRFSECRNCSDLTLETLVGPAGRRRPSVRSTFTYS